MIDGDDAVRKRYRELASEEPSRVLDEAILAASRRAAARRPMQRWAMPVSIAAVLVLALGVTLRMQREEPGIESSLPTERQAAPAAPSPQAQPAPPAEAPARAATAPAAQTPVPARKDKALQAPAQDLGARRDAEVATQKRAATNSLAKEAVPAPPPPQKKVDQAAEAGAATANVANEPRAREEKIEAAKPQALQAPAPKPFADAVAPAAPPAAARMQQAPAAAGVAAAPARAKTEMQEGARPDDKAGPLERELERIAKLRRDGKNAEADEALEKFRRENPGYRIPDAVWEQVKPR